MRTVADIDAAIATVRARRNLCQTERDRQERNMLTALAEVERVEAQLAADQQTLDQLLDERIRTADRQIIEALR